MYGVDIPIPRNETSDKIAKEALILNSPSITVLLSRMEREIIKKLAIGNGNKSGIKPTRIPQKKKTFKSRLSMAHAFVEATSSHYFNLNRFLVETTSPLTLQRNVQQSENQSE